MTLLPLSTQKVMALNLAHALRLRLSHILPAPRQPFRSLSWASQVPFDSYWYILGALPVGGLL